MEIYLVGGAVRDRLLGLPVKDRDYVVVGVTPEQMEAKGFRPVGADFPVFLHPETHEEYALARTERKSGRGYKGFQVFADPGVTLEQDLHRRDLTINAMAEDASGKIIDPFNGQDDVQNGFLRHVSPAFVEDPVRVLRVARFAARFKKYGFRVAHGTHALMKNMVANGEVDHLVPERVWSETERALAEDNPEEFFRVLRACGALEKLFPEIDALYGVPQPEAHHPEVDTGVHCMMVLQQAARLTPDARTRFAALVHDLGKATTPESEWPRHIAHEARGAGLVEAMAQRLRIPNSWRELAVKVARHHGVCHRAAELKPSTLLRILEQLDALRQPGELDAFLLACEADARGRAGFEQAKYPQAELFRQACAAATSVNTSVIAAEQKALGKSGEQIGEAIRQERSRAIEQAIKR
ncbi:MAG: multifunctional CCA addition/repair protein [Gammaproteobacteria bacterium]|nr:multifunctional CCA addition/repair protein [Gammaproteobacteria bacterium]